MPFFTYILQNRITKKYYVGSCENLNTRIDRHNKGYVKSTKSGSPNWEVVYFEDYEDRSAAQAREYAIKKKKSRKYIEYLISRDDSFD